MNKKEEPQTPFTLCFYNQQAKKEYDALDGSVKKLLRPGLRKLMQRADTLGTPLHGSLEGCKKLKYRKDGWRVVFKLSDEKVQIVEIIATGKRNKSAVYHKAEARLKHATHEPKDFV